MGSKSVFGNIVHALGSYLYLHPSVVRSQHGYVQTLVAVRLGTAEPVAHSLGVRLIHIGDYGEHLPAVGMFALWCRIQNDAQGKEVEHSVHIHLLFLHLLPDAVNGLRALLDVIFQRCLFQTLVDALNESCNILFTLTLFLIQFVGDVVIYIVLGIFQAEVFEFCLHHIETQFVGKRSIQVCSLRHKNRVGILCIITTDVCQAAGNHI